MLYKQTMITIAASILAACFAVTSGSTAVKAAEFSTANTSNCSACHQKQSNTASAQVLLGKHAAASLDCFACHEKSELEAKHQDKTKVPARLIRKRKYPNEFCLRCHGNYAQLAEKTKASKVFVALDGRVINPHAIDATVHSDEHNQKECYNCHKMHETAQPIDYCYGCHHSRQLNSCKECHSKGK